MKKILALLPCVFSLSALAMHTPQFDAGVGLGRSLKTIRYSTDDGLSDWNLTLSSVLVNANAEFLFKVARCFGLGIGGLYNYTPSQYFETNSPNRYNIKSYYDLALFIRPVWFVTSRFNLFALLGPEWQRYDVNYYGDVLKTTQVGVVAGLGMEARFGKRNQYGVRLAYLYSKASDFSNTVAGVRSTYDPQSDQFILGFNYYFGSHAAKS